MKQRTALQHLITTHGATALRAMTRGMVCGLALLCCMAPPALAQEVSANFGQGSLRVGYDALGCDSAREGALRFNSSNDLWQYCHNNNWEAFASAGASNLSTLSDVNITTPLADDVLLYDSAAQEWVNGKIGASTTLATLSDVDLTAPADQEVLRYVSATGEWANNTMNLSELGTVNITSPQNRQYLLYSGGNWINQYATLPILTDTSIGGLSSDQILVYYNNRWRNVNNNFQYSSDIGLSSPSNGEVLRYNGSSWTDGPPSSGTLAAQSDTNITSPAYFQVLLHNGTEWVNGTPVTSWALSDLTDVNLTGLTAGHTLRFQGAQWISSVLDLVHLDDTLIVGLSSGHALIYDGTDWRNRTMRMTDMDDASISGPSNGQTLLYNGTNWVNMTVPVPILGALNDVTITSPLESEILRYDGDTSQWVNGLAISGANPPISPYKKFDANAAAPITCNGTNTGALAINTGGKTCACNGTGWIFDDGTACVW